MYARQEKQMFPFSPDDLTIDPGLMEPLMETANKTFLHIFEHFLARPPFITKDKNKYKFHLPFFWSPITSAATMVYSVESIDNRWYVSFDPFLSHPHPCMSSRGIDWISMAYVRIEPGLLKYADAIKESFNAAKIETSQAT